MADDLHAHIHGVAAGRGNHPMRRAEDIEEQQIRMRVWEQWLRCYSRGDHALDALNHALDEYRRELAALALKRCGARL